jgi:hypothetical protein
MRLDRRVKAPEKPRSHMRRQLDERELGMTAPISGHHDLL